MYVCMYVCTYAHQHIIRMYAYMNVQMHLHAEISWWDASVLASQGHHGSTHGQLTSGLR